MSVEGVIFDVSDTLLTRRTAVPGTVDMVDRLRDAGVRIIAVHNDGPRTQVAQRLAQAGLAVDLVVTRQEVGRAKGSPQWIDWIMGQTGLERHELFYVGDSHYDMITAANSRVVYCHAVWANPQHTYGLPAPAPGWVAAVVLHIFRKQHPWGWTHTYQSPYGPRFRLRALIDGNGAGSTLLKTYLIALLKDRFDSGVGLLSLRDFIGLHLLASISAEGLSAELDLWTSYPARDGTRQNRLVHVLDLMAKLFRETYIPDLLERHTPAMHSRAAFRRGAIAGALDNQLTTIRVNPMHHERIANQRILLLDDFVTRGVTVGVGRLALCGAGATEVTVVSVGKYGEEVCLVGLPDGHAWDGQHLPSFVGQEMPRRMDRAAVNHAALAEFLASYQALQHERW